MSPANHIRCRECRTPNEPGALFCVRCGASLTGSVPGGRLPRGRRVTAAGAAMGFALFLVLLIVTFTLGFIVYRGLDLGAEADPGDSRPGTTATIVTESSDSEGGGNPGSSPSANPAMVLRPPSVSASSVLAPTTSSNFRAPNLIDGDLTTAWSEGKDGPGAGEWVRFDFFEPVVVDRLEIANGYQKDDDWFSSTARIKSLKLEYSNGATQLVELVDTKDLQTVTAARRNTEWVRLTVLSVFPDYEWDNASLSEVRIYVVLDEQ